ncbi:MAG: CHAT domain-containing protein [Saprospiraceae bacterium]
MYQEVSAFWAESGNKTQQQYLGMAQHYLAMLYENTGRAAQAEPLFRAAKTDFETSKGKNHPEYAACLFAQGCYLARQGKTAQAIAALTEANGIERSLVKSGCTYLPERELQLLADKTRRSAGFIYSWLSKKSGSEDDALSAICYDNTLFDKGFLLQARLTVDHAVAQADSNTQALFGRWRDLQRHMAVQYTDLLRDSTYLAGLEEQANTMEKELTREVAALGQVQRQLNWQEVQQNLQPGEAALEFVQNQHVFPKNTDSTMYAALVLRLGDVQPRFIPLFEEKSLDCLLQTQGERKEDYVNNLFALAARGARPLGKPKKTLYDLIWKPLEKALAGVKTIYFSPSGLLHRLNLAAIPINPDTVLGDQYNLVELGSTRQLVIPTTVIPAANDAVLFGDIAYDADSTAMSQANAALDSVSIASRGELSFSYTDSTERVGTWGDLYYTGKEVESLGSILKSGGIQPQTYRGYAATEAVFKSIGNSHGVTRSHPVTGSPRVLHIATHGFFFPDPQTSEGFKTLPTLSEPAFKLSDHPMIRSGLILAGGNHAWATGKPLRPGMEDGILTAYEISQMNLSNTELVVLSACETGLGDIEGNEGVYGLQRAFKIAGAKYLIMSLWKVDDGATMKFMEVFYRKWLEGKTTIPEAFRATQADMREWWHGKSYYWAGFVLVE